MPEIGYAIGVCPRCGKMLRRKRPVDVAVCDCWKYCPVDHGNGSYGTKMEEYSPDLTPRTYGPIKTESGDAWGDLEHPIKILRKCSICGYHSAQEAIEVELV